MGTALYDITVQASLSIYAGNDTHSFETYINKVYTKLLLRYLSFCIEIKLQGT